jgi:Uma2 family endonuclease
MSVMAPPSVERPRPLTYEDYRLLPDDGKRYELIEGELFIVSPAPSTRHQAVLANLIFALMAALQKPGLARVLPAPTDLVLSPNNVVQPDLTVIAAPNVSIITARAVEGVPEIAVEILSPSSLDRDRYIKKRLYQQFGVREYWVVDTETDSLLVYRLDQGSYGIRARYDRDSIVESPDFPSLRIPAIDIFG